MSRLGKHDTRFAAGQKKKLAPVLPGASVISECLDQHADCLRGSRLEVEFQPPFDCARGTEVESTAANSDAIRTTGLWGTADGARRSAKGSVQVVADRVEVREVENVK